MNEAKINREYANEEYFIYDFLKDKGIPIPAEKTGVGLAFYCMGQEKTSDFLELGEKYNEQNRKNKVGFIVRMKKVKEKGKLIKLLELHPRTIYDLHYSMGLTFEEMSEIYDIPAVDISALIVYADLYYGRKTWMGMLRHGIRLIDVKKFVKFLSE